MSSRRFVFNLYESTASTTAGDPVYLYSGDPVIVLEETQAYYRQKTQSDALGEPQGTYPMFDQDLTWAYREYIIRQLWSADEQDDPNEKQDVPIGNALPRSVEVGQRQWQIKGAGDRLKELPAELPEDGSRYLYLFNVIVALEWLPQPRFLRQLEWTFRRASDYLYDVTNGCMAFGQVVFADSSWMDCADIQLVASNRCMPRSWTSGLLEDRKYTPIRIGRGLWARDQRIVVPWDEPEGYRALIHEWGHYALGLKDDYLESRRAKNDNGKLVLDESGPFTIVTPKRRGRGKSIMANPEGNSELDYPLSRHKELGATIQTHYPNLNIEWFNGEFDGPGRLPLPLPYFRREGVFSRNWVHNEMRFGVPLEGAPHGQESEFRISQGLDNEPVRDWKVYVIWPEAKRIIAQGEIDGRYTRDGLLLLGAREGDSVVLIGRGDNGVEVWERPIGTVEEEREQVEAQLRVLKANAGDQPVSPEGAMTNVPSLAQSSSRSPEGAGASRPGFQWRPRSPFNGPVSFDPESGPPNFNTLGDVLPQPVQPLPERPDDYPRYADIIIEAAGASNIKIFGLGGDAPIDFQPNAPAMVPSLDGLVRIELGEALMICEYSEGGGPGESAPNVVRSPLTGGAASGDALLFFDQADNIVDRKIRIVTTTLPFSPENLGGGFEARSPIFSIASNKPLPMEHNPTLVIFNSSDPGEEAMELAIFRLVGNSYTKVPTFVAQNQEFAAIPLSNLDWGGSLVTDTDSGKHVERYVLGVAKVAQVQDDTADGTGAQAANNGVGHTSQDVPASELSFTT